MAPLSQKRQQVLDFIREFVGRKGYPPTIRDIMNGCDSKSIAAIQLHLRKLEEEDYISRDPHVRRGITLPERPRYTVEVPVLGYIAAGQPIPVPRSDAWREEPLETLELPTDIAPDRDNIYALRVKGLSMIDALIDDGDIVVMEATNTVDNGDMAAVWLKKEQEVTLKRIYREPNRIRLQPENRQMKPIYHNPENVEIQGRVIGVIRNLKRRI
jgi:repressor LexA